MSDRVRKSFLNARISFIFYFLFLFLSFFSRKLFLDSLGAEFIGLTGTLQNILGLLSLAELGIGTAVNYHLYKPLQNKDYDTINKIISLFGWLYRYIGIFILGCGIILSLFFPLIFKDATIDTFTIYYAFYVLLSSSLIGYFINFRQVLLGADQKNYIVSAYLQTGLIVKILVQMLICVVCLNYLLWLSVDVIFVFVSCIILNKKIDKEYVWLKLSVNCGNEYRKEFPGILRDVRRVFIHKIKDFLLSQSDQILVFVFVSLKMVAYYGNYTLVFSKASQLFVQVFNSISASIGNLVAEGNMKKIYQIFWELLALRYYISGIIVALCFFLMQPFIQLWLGEEYVLSDTILLLLCFNTYMMLTRGVVDSFNHSYGLYADVWSAWVELIINIVITVCLAIPYGLIGILLGKIASLLFIVLWWKPYYLFTKGFKYPTQRYFKRIFVYYFSYVGVFLFAHFIVGRFLFDVSNSVFDFLLYALVVGVSFSAVYGLVMLLLFREMRGISQRMLSIVRIRK